MLPIVFSSLETGAPVLNNAAGALIGVLATIAGTQIGCCS